MAEEKFGSFDFSSISGFDLVGAGFSAFSAAADAKRKKAAFEIAQFKRRFGIQAQNLQATANDAKMNVAASRDIAANFRSTEEAVLALQLDNGNKLRALSDQTQLVAGAIQSSASARNLSTSSGSALALLKESTIKASRGAAIANATKNNAAKNLYRQYDQFVKSRPLVRSSQQLFIPEPFTGPSAGEAALGAAAKSLF